MAAHSVLRMPLGMRKSGRSQIKQRKKMRTNITWFQTIPVGLALVLIGGSVSAGELDPSQQNWFRHYEKQANLPKPGDMLLNTDPEPDLSEGFISLFNSNSSIRVICIKS